MIERDDHPKVTARQIRLNMITGNFDESTKEPIESQSNSIADSKSEINDFRFGTFHYKKTIDDEVKEEYSVGMFANSYAEFESKLLQLGEQIVDGEITLTAHKHDKWYDDIDPPSPENLEKAIAIMDDSNPIDIVIPDPQSIDSPSWD